MADRVVISRPHSQYEPVHDRLTGWVWGSVIDWQFDFVGGMASRGTAPGSRQSFQNHASFVGFGFLERIRAVGKCSLSGV